MYVCICNAVTTRHIAEARAQGADSLRALRERLGVGNCCGKCCLDAHNLLRQQQAQPPCGAAACPS
ncbi:(2Fe-2S)-binding protein [Rhodocyclus tenuis]|uniref:Bacterioferritin-associated ferredoxin n=1 Tax=Rhodocyclus tenuis TaxID=1066 RepID=A0A840G0L0_RHOTE|nr:(2Fe-2S)-binding protein [Rhodocyclus tenuis]MBB4247937.1 bacterioferritin-associated ferredoxin [Rhodocyclus tenuis]